MIHYNQPKTLFAGLSILRNPLVLVAFVALATALPLHAESPASAPEAPDPNSEQMQSARQLHGEIMELEKRLGSIYQSAMQAHPELQKQKEELHALIRQKMNSSPGINADDQMAAINEIEKKLHNKDTPDSEREKLIADYKKKAKTLRETRMKVMQDPEIQKAGNALDDATLAAMKQQDPESARLMEQMKQKEAEMQALMKASQ